jgi:hypothetical protein
MDPESRFFPSRIPDQDPGVKKTPDPKTAKIIQKIHRNKIYLKIKKDVPNIR